MIVVTETEHGAGAAATPAPARQQLGPQRPQQRSALRDANLHKPQLSRRNVRTRPADGALTRASAPRHREVMKIRRLRTKPCNACKQEHDALFRARPNSGEPWRFYCQACLLKLKASSRSYAYGGTWKSKKRT